MPKSSWASCSSCYGTGITINNEPPDCMGQWDSELKAYVFPYTVACKSEEVEDCHCCNGTGRANPFYEP